MGISISGLEKVWSFVVFKGYIKGTLAWYRLIGLLYTCFCLKFHAGWCQDFFHLDFCCDAENERRHVRNDTK